MDAPEEPWGQEAPSTEVCMSFCRHCFCFPCIQEWARRRVTCPRCQCSLSHIFPLRDTRIHEGHAEGGGNPARRRNDGFYRRARARGHGGSGSWRWRRTDRRWWWRRRGRRANARSRRRFRGMAWDMDRNVGQDLLPWAVLGSSRRSQQQPGTRRRRRRHRGQARGQRRRDRYEQPR